MNKERKVIMKVYIAGKISGCPEYKEFFEAAAKKVISMGNEPVIPYKGTSGRETYKEYIDHGLSLLKDCDAIFMLRNWPDSRGATLERMYAEVVDIPIIEERIDI
jgi:hypothetical protein